MQTRHGHYQQINPAGFRVAGASVHVINTAAGPLGPAAALSLMLAPTLQFF